MAYWPPYLPAAGMEMEGTAGGERAPEQRQRTPYIVNIHLATMRNRYYRNVIWTGRHLQLALMSIDPGGDIGLEVHPQVDQFIRIEQGQGLVRTGRSRDRLDFERAVRTDDVIIIPAGTWHNVINTGRNALKLYTIYAPPEHKAGTVHKTKADAVSGE